MKRTSPATKSRGKSIPFTLIMLAGALFFIPSLSPASTVTYTYDDAGALVEANYGDKTITYTYDSAGNLLEERIGAPGSAYTLAVTKSGAGSGTVTSSPKGIDCGSVCAKSFDSGTSVKLTAKAAKGSTFTGWSGSGCSGKGSCAVTMSAKKEVTATFTSTLAVYTLTVTKKGAGVGTVTSSPKGITCGSTCSGQYKAGSKVTLTAKAQAGSAFVEWSGGCTGEKTCKITMTGNKSAGAAFSSEANIAVTPPSKDFGTVKTGKIKTANFKVTNKGAADLAIGTITIDGANGSEFAAKTDSCSGKSIKQKASCTVAIKFTPASSGAKAASMHIPSNDPDTPTLGVALTGTGS